MLTSRSVTNVHEPTHVVQPVQTAGQGKAVPEMLCETVDVADPELMSEFTPPEEPRPPLAPPPAGRTDEYKKRGYKVGKRLQS